MVVTSLSLQVADIVAEAKDVVVVELRDPRGVPLPPFEAGAHVELLLGNGLRRQYSISSDPGDTSRYRIGVGLARDSRGGSQFVHKSLRVGDKLSVGVPRNLFPMVPDASAHAFIAGGIGITPIMAMIRSCETRRIPWTLTYLVRSRQRAAFLEELSEFGSRVTLHCDDEAGVQIDVAGVLAGIPLDHAVYCCGPIPLMTAVEQAVGDRPEELVRFEWFTARADLPTPPKDGFLLRLAKSGVVLEVSADQTILEAMEAHGFEPPYACREGICGSCELAVVAGIPDHRDQVLTKSEQTSNKTVIICCSRSLSDELVIDY